MMQTCRRFHPRSPAAFSLVELLLVIGIIGILISLTLPSLAHARKSGMTAKCGSNLHQISIALNNYSVDWFDITPREGIAPWIDGLSGYQRIPWVEAVRPYVVHARRDQLESPVFLDPAHPNPNHHVHYVINGLDIPPDGDLGGADLDSTRRNAGPISRVRYPDRMIYMTEFARDLDNSIAKEVRAWDLEQAAGVYDVWNIFHLQGRDHDSDNNAIHILRITPGLHQGKNNILYIDSHIAQLPGDTLHDPAQWDDGY